MIETIFSKLYFLMRLVMLHFILSACGLFIFGLSPANATIIHLYKSKKDRVDEYHFSEAFTYFKKHFLLANLLFYLLGMMAIFFLYIGFLYTNFSENILLLLMLILQVLFAIFSFAIYGAYLQLQIYYDFTITSALKLSVIGVFMDFSSLFKWLIGSFVCFFLMTKMPLILVIFVPVVWLLFSSDILEPIYHRIKERVQP